MAIVEKLQEYALKKGISSFNLYIEVEGLHEYTDTIHEKDLSRLLVGHTFRTEKSLMEELMPDIVLDNSYQLLAFTSDYIYYFRQRPDIAVLFFNHHQDILNKFSLKNKEIYYWMKKALGEDIKLLEESFRNVLSHKVDVLCKKESITYSLDYDKILETSGGVMFRAVEHIVEQIFYLLKPETYQKLGVGNIFSQVKSCNADICFLEVKDKEFLDKFMEGLVNFIHLKMTYQISKISQEDIDKLLDYLCLDYQLEEKTNIKTHKI